MREAGGERPQTEAMEADVVAPPAETIRRTLLRGGVLAAFSHRDFRILWPGAFLSNVGTWIHTTALLWFVKELTGSNAWVGAVNMASYLPVFLLVLWAGSLADQLNRKRLILVTQAVMMLGALALGICVSAGWASLPAIMVVTAVMGIAFVFNFPAWRAIVPDLVPRRDILNGIALDAAQFNLARCVGPALGALILNLWNVQAAFYVNAASFLTVILALSLVRTSTPGAPHPEGTRRHMAEGIRHTLGQSWSRSLLVILALLSFFGLSFLVLLPGVSKDVLGRGAGGYGLLLGAVGLGAVIGAPLVTFLRRYLREGDIIRYSILGFGLFLLTLSLCRTYWLCLLLTVGTGAAGLMMSATINTVLQSRVERGMRGRIMSLYILVFQGIFPMGGLFLGYLSDLWSVPSAMLLGGAVCTATAAATILFPSLLREATSSGHGAP